MSTTGIEEYKNSLISKINHLLQTQSDKPYLVSFKNYIIEMEKSSVYSYLLYVTNFLNTTGKEPKDLEYGDYLNYMAGLEDKTSSYKIAVYSSLKKFSRFAYISHLSKEDYMSNINRPKAEESDNTIEKRAIGYLEKKEIHTYLNKIESGVGSHMAMLRQKDWKERDELIILMLLNTGMRCSALYKLDVSSIDFENKSLSVRDKGNKRHEYILSDDLLKKIDIWLEQREKLLLGHENENEEALFISNRRTRMNQLSISRIVEKYAEDIDGKHITPHKLRATYGTQLYNATHDIYFVQTCMGHTNPKTTELYIRGKNTSNKEKAVNIMNKLTNINNV